MIHPSWLTLLCCLALLVPPTQAGTQAEPEFADAVGDAPSGLDVAAAWFSDYAVQPRPVGLGNQCTTAPVAGTRCVDVECSNLINCDKGVRVTVQLKDLYALAQPLADADPSTVRYFYVIEFTPESYGQKVAIECMLNHANLVRGGARLYPLGAEHEVWDVGLRCYNQGTRSTFTGPYTVVNSGSARTDGTFTFALTSGATGIQSGEILSGLTVTSYAGSATVSGTTPALAVRTVADTPDAPGSDYTVV